MNKIIEKNFINWRQIYDRITFKYLGFTCRVCRPFTKHRERIQKFREKYNLKHL